MDEKLTSNEQILRLVIEHTPAAVAMFDREMRYIAYSKRFLQDYQLEDQNLEGKSHYEVFPEISERWKEIHKRCLAGGTESADADPFPRADGKVDYVRWEIQPWSDLNGKIGGIILFSEVITDRIQSENALRESEEFLSVIYKNLDVGIFLLSVNEDGSYTYEGINPKHEILIGIKNAEIAGKKPEYLVDIFGKESIDYAISLYSECIRKKSPVESEYFIPEGPAKGWWFIKISPLFEPITGRVGRLIGIGFKITEQKQAELSLLESQKKLQAILDNTDSLIYIKDLQGKLMLVNNKFESMFGMPAKHFIGKTSHDLFSKEIADIHWKNDQKIISKQTQLVFEEIIYDAAGKHPYLSTKFPLLDASEKMYAICSISTDITDLKFAQTELIRSHEELRLVTSRLAKIQETERKNIAKELHDRVGQNLTGLNISLNIIRSHLDVNTQQKLAETFDSTQSLLDEVTDQIREVMAELHPPVLEDYGLAAALRWYADRISKQTNLKIDVEGEIIEPRLELPVSMTLFRISQEALNNVIKHAHANSVKITLKSQNNFVELLIVDDGSGFEPDLTVPISYPHWGLSTMKERARAVDGYLDIHSTPGAGTEILVRIPK